MSGPRKTRADWRPCGPAKRENLLLRAEVEELKAASERLSQALEGAERKEEDALNRFRDALKRLEEINILCESRGVQVEELELVNQELAETVQKLKGRLACLLHQYPRTITCACARVCSSLRMYMYIAPPPRHLFSSLDSCQELPHRNLAYGRGGCRIYAAGPRKGSRDEGSGATG